MLRPDERYGKCFCCSATWNLPENKEALKNADRRYHEWIGVNCSRYDLREHVLSNLYAMPLIAKLSLVFAAGRRAGMKAQGRCMCDLAGTQEEFVKIQSGCPELFQPYSYESDWCGKNLYHLFMMGYFSV